MAFGQSYWAFKIVKSVVTKIERAAGATEEEAREAGNVIGGCLAGCVGIITMDAAGGAATVAEITASKLKP